MPAPASAEILLADDDLVLLNMVAEGLSLAGYSVRQASQGQGALKLCRELQPDLAILDIGMPDLNGIELAKLLNREFHIPVLFLSGHGERGIVDQAMTSAGELALGYLLKPVKIDSLIPQVQAALELSQHISILRSRESRLQDSLSSSHDINLATGILMERFHLGQNEAEDTLRQLARSERRKMAELASEIIEASNRLKSPSKVQQILLERDANAKKRSKSEH